jgi:hypothetical protein
MSDFQEQAKNWLRNVVKQNPDKIKAGVEKAGDLIDKQTGGKYAEKVDAVQQKVGGYVDSHQQGEDESSAGEPSARADEPQPAGSASAEGESASADDGAGSEAGGGVAEPGGGADPEAEGVVVGGEAPDPSTEPTSSAGSRPEGAQTGGTVTGSTEVDESPHESDGGLPGPRP